MLIKHWVSFLTKITQSDADMPAVYQRWRIIHLCLSRPTFEGTRRQWHIKAVQWKTVSAVPKRANCRSFCQLFWWATLSVLQAKLLHRLKRISQKLACSLSICSTRRVTSGCRSACTWRHKLRKLLRIIIITVLFWPVLYWLLDIQISTRVNVSFHLKILLLDTLIDVILCMIFDVLFITSSTLHFRFVWRKKLVLWNFRFVKFRFYQHMTKRLQDMRCHFIVECHLRIDCRRYNRIREPLVTRRPRLHSCTHVHDMAGIMLLAVRQTVALEGLRIQSNLWRTM